MTPKHLKTLEWYAWRVGKDGRAARNSSWVIMPLENIHLLQKLAGEKLAPPDGDLTAFRVPVMRVLGWLRLIADNYPQAPQEVAGGW